MRIQIELSEKGVDILNQIRAAIGESTSPGGKKLSHRELFDYAIAFLSWGIRERQKGRIIASLSEGEKNYKEVTMPIFDWVAAQQSPAEATAEATVAAEKSVKKVARGAGAA